VATRSLVAELTAHHNWITVLVSHHRDDIEALAKREYTIEEGRLVLMR
jgi:thiamine transport system ATP-binding protein